MTHGLWQRINLAYKAVSGKLASLSDYELDDIGDDIIEKFGLDYYWKMVLTDDEVASDIDHAVNHILSGVTYVPGDETDEGKRNCDFVIAVNEKMEGSTLETYQAIVFNALVTGCSIAEPLPIQVNLPEFGDSYGLRDIYVRPSKSFFEAMPMGIRTDRFGNIVEFVQSKEYGGFRVRPDEVFYWAHRGGPDQRAGRSLLRRACAPHRAKEEMYKHYPLWIATNASGYREAKIPDDDFDNEQKKSKAKEVMKKMARWAAIVTAKSWEVKTIYPPAGGGKQFETIINNCDNSIRRAILGDSAFSAQAGSQGSQASREVSQENVRSHFAVIGSGFCESMTEQVNTMLLAWNGFSGAVPKMIPKTTIFPEEALALAEQSLGNLKKNGLIKGSFSKKTTLQLVNFHMAPTGIIVESMDDDPEPTFGLPSRIPTVAPEGTEEEVEPAEVPDKKTTPTEPEEQKPDLNARTRRAAGQIKRGMRESDDLKAHSTKWAGDLSAKWTELVPEILGQLSKALFQSQAGGGWKTTDLNEIRQVIVEKVRYKSSEVRKIMLASQEAAYDKGAEAAASYMPVRAVLVGRTRKGWTPSQARQILNGKVMLLLEREYMDIAHAMFLLMVNAVTGEVAPNTAVLQMKDLLASHGYPEGRAFTVVHTGCASAWNAARMNLFSEFEDANGMGISDIIAYEFLAVDDDRTSPACEELMNAVFACDDPSLPVPPLHYNCRSMLLPVFGTERDLVRIMNTSDSAVTVNQLRAEGHINEGFGGF